MKWQAVLAGALASGLAISVAYADVRIVGDRGGEVSSYIHKFRAVRDSGQRVVIDGPCLSACTLLTGIIPRDRICVTARAMLGFHAASYYDDASRSLVPTREGSRLVMQLYPPADPVLDRPAWRAHPAAHHVARPGTRRALPHLPVNNAGNAAARPPPASRRLLPLPRGSFRPI